MPRASRSRHEHYRLRFLGIASTLALGTGLLFWLHSEKPSAVEPRAKPEADTLARGEIVVAASQSAPMPVCAADAGCARPRRPREGSEVKAQSERTPSLTHPLSAALDPSDGTAERLRAAWENAVAECMRGRGFPYASTRRSEAAADAGASDPNAALLAKMTPDERARWEHALIGDAPQSATDTDQVALDVTDSVGMRWPDHACATEADRKLYGDDAEYRNLQMQLTLVREKAHEAADRDPAYLAGMRGYARCMAKGGKTVSPSVLDGEDALDDEADVVDGVCRSESGIMALRDAARARAEQDAAERNKHDLAALVELHEGALATHYAEAD